MATNPALCKAIEAPRGLPGGQIAGVLSHRCSSRHATGAVQRGRRPPEIETTSYAVAARALTREAFPDEGKWLKISDQRRQLRWLDASHLDERSAIIVADQIEKAIAAHR